MTTISRRFAIRKWTGLLLCSSLVFLFVCASALADQIAVEFSNDRVTIIAKDELLADVIELVASKGKLRVVQHVALSGTISLQVTEVPLDKALGELLKQYSYQLYQSVPDSPVPGTLWVFSKGTGAASAAEVFFEAVILYGSVAEKKSAIRELRRLATPEAVATLSLALGDTDKRVRTAAIEALADIGSDDALAAVASAMAVADPWLRGQAVNALSAGDSETARQYLSLAATDPDPNVRLAVIEAFADNPNNQSVAMLSMALRDEDPLIRMYAVDALEEIGGELAFEALMNASGDEVDESLSSLMRQP